MDDEGQVLLELERLRGAVNEGFAKLGGRLDTQDQRSNNQENDISGLKKDVETLKTRVWTATVVAALVSGGGAAGATQVLGG